MIYRAEFDCSAGPDDNENGTNWDVVGDDNGRVCIMATHCTKENAETIVCGLNDYQERTERAMRWSSDLRRIGDLETLYFDLSIAISKLIPPIDGERANDPIIGRVERVMATVKECVEYLESDQDWQLVLSRLNETISPQGH